MNYGNSSGFVVGRCEHCKKPVVMTFLEMKNYAPYTHCEACRSRPELFGFTDALDDLPSPMRKVIVDKRRANNDLVKQS